jgi:hypothetical protein
MRNRVAAFLLAKSCGDTAKFLGYTPMMENNIEPFRAIVRVLWDGEASVWVATSDDVPGLVVEMATFDEIVTEVRALAPELLRLNTGVQPAILDLHFLADRLESIAA